ncbi:sigma54-dependent activator protein [Azotobacter vinelandii CA]|uniref:Sigma54-dependent activator protein n=2 Tax=Azotobacter vinelandii TaxID=354 RepID=C1DN78_AZOVD|nr:sigma-54-dependent Fis family transcriptional regulator [Azotobacter vinelandii]ACO79245.1 sigma54-dependent activator protein [Azotobacter vinelandii DJ]AGK13666.1 sigma54-dependent activator protein [Azotobacter vinelandii CA]AGK18191.1 sigma54-dependent activator protein [Azotobacter vinelandii CA6]SFY27980.1 regulatory protein, Fis family [Azotobacter vinelandii]GLK61880.1 sigma-54-dependent Fis family transcriptional regulator [Azotobacter vinelandii]
MAVQRLIERFNLRSRLRFDIDAGQIWLDESRMLLFHAKAVGALRRELFDSLGAKRAQGLLFRMGFAAGQQDADLASKLLGEGDNYDVFQIGPELHAFEGLVKTVLMDAHIDWEQGCFFGEAKCENSWEAESHLQQFGIGEDTACWTLAGYASGYVTRFFRRFIVFRETQCTCRGDPHCVLVGKPVEAWGDDAYLEYCRPQDLEPSLRELQRELWQLRGGQREQHAPGRLVGASPGFRTAFDLLGKAARTPITVLLLGETGVGKEVFARWLHENSERAEQPFVAVNCAAIPNDLIESELFGVQKGAFTGAQQSRPGRFERADGGTLFLDELGDLSSSAQVKLLRVLQTGEVERLGDDKARKVDVRLVAATNVDLQRAMAEGRFRADLYYRLATYPVTIPPLRERKSDIPLLVAALLEKYAPIYHKKLPGLTDRAMQALMAHRWPGNVRELENLIERAVLLVPSGTRIEVEHLFAGCLPAPPCGAAVDRQGLVGNADEARRELLYDSLLDDGFDLQAHEARLLELAVRRAKGNLTHAARLLGITRRQLAYRLKQASGENRPSPERT